jgi:tRNA 2-thiouridine synthesizing protein A
MSKESRQPVVLDVKGLNCPMPLLKAKKALNELEAEALLQVLATDPGSVRDFETFSRQSGHSLLESRQEGDTFIYLLRKKSA